MKHFNFFKVGFLAAIILLFSGFMLADAPSKVPSEITEAITKGDSDELSFYFNSNLELVMLDKVDICTKKQAKLIIEDFFTSNHPQNFEIIYEGQQSDGIHVFGKMLTSSEKTFNVYFLVKSTEEQVVITQFKVEEQ
jgi:hypothetical protein